MGLEGKVRWSGVKIVHIEVTTENGTVLTGQ